MLSFPYVHHIKSYVYRQFNSNYSMSELVLPIGTSQEEIKCIQDIARKLGMTTILGNQVRNNHSVLIMNGHGV